MDVLDIVARAGEPLRFTDILTASGQPRGTLHRHLSNLVGEGLVEHTAAGTYALGLRLLQFAALAWSGNDLRQVAAPHLTALHDAVGETVHLAVLRGAEVVYLDKVESRASVRMHSQIGRTAPAFCTGVGKAALAVLPEGRLAPLLAATAFHAYTPATLMTPEALRAELAAIRAAGVAYDREEHEAGIRCVAAPIHAADLSLVGGLSVTGPSFRVSEAQLQGWAGLVAATAAAIMKEMGPRLGPRARD